MKMEWKRMIAVFMPSILGLVILAILMFTDVTSKMTYDEIMLSYAMLPFSVAGSVFLSTVKD